MRFRVLGPLEVVSDSGQVTRVEGGLRRLLLTALLSEANRPLSDTELVSALWGDNWDTLATDVRRGLREQVHRLRKLLRAMFGEQAAPLERVHDAYVLAVGPDDLDELICVRLMEQARRLVRSDPPAAADRADRALALWRGTPLAGLDERPFVARYQRRLLELRLNTVKQRAEAYLASARPGPLLTDLPPVLADYPDDESLRSSLAMALYRDGRRDEALRVCRDGLGRLDERGLISEPLRELERAILNDSDRLRWTPPRSARPAGGQASIVPVPAQLPASPRHFTGRRVESRRLFQLLENASGSSSGTAVATITGRPGVGKTALALHVAHRSRDGSGQFPHGALFANLRPLSGEAVDPSYVLAGFLLALGTPRERIPDDLASREALYRSALDGRRILVLLDNAVSEDQVRPLLPGTSTCAVLVTSARVLPGLDADEIRLDSLDADDSLALLAEIAGPERVYAEVDEAREIVRLCGYLPIAVRNAAAWLTRQPALALGRLRQELAGAPLTVLRRTGELEVPRSFALSYRDLSPEARRAFRLLSVPEGEEVGHLDAMALTGLGWAATERVLDELVAAHLIDQVTDNRGTESRFRFHDLLRLYAREPLEVRDDADRDEWARERHAAFGRLLETTLAAAERAAQLLHPGNTRFVQRVSDPLWLPDPRAVERVVAEPNTWFARRRADLVTLTDQAAAGGYEELTWLVGFALVDFFEATGTWIDGSRTMETALAAARRRRAGPAEANALRLLGLLDRLRGDRRSARQLLLESLRQFRALHHQLGEAAAQRNLADLYLDDGMPERALDQAERSRLIYLEHGQQFGVARALATAGRGHLRAGRVAEALTRLQVAVATFATEGNVLAGRQTSLDLGAAYLRAGRTEDARQILAEVEHYFETEGHPLDQARALLLLAEVHGRAGDDADAFAAYDRCIAIYQARRDNVGQARCLAQRGRLLAWAGDNEAAGASWRQALALWRDRDSAERDEIRRWLAGDGPDPRRGDIGRRLHGGFDHGRVTQAVAASAYLIRIMSTWTEMLDLPHRDGFLGALGTALANGAHVEILLLDPDSRYADERSRDLGGGVDVAALVRAGLDTIGTFAKALPEPSRRRLVVRLYDGAPKISLYRSDETMLASWLSQGESPSRGRQYEIGLDSDLAQFIEQQFEDTWRTSQPFTVSG
jgi:DNA-binding SARP family transcriptional activator/tetratricopeptide (TPR) repeat protein